jgi:3-oxoacyl-[acyl-carrier-protein] synthase II
MLPARIAGTVPEDELAKFRFTEHPRFIRLALIAAQEAITDSKIELDPSCGVSIGSGMSCVEEIVKEAAVMEARGHRRVSPHFVPRILGNMAAGHISIRWGLNGPVFSPSTACATGASAVGEAFRAIKHGDTNVMLAGATESCIDPLSIAGFCQAKALTTHYNDEPGLASRPFDRRRSGFVMGEGAAVLILEEHGRAKARGATMLCEILGYGSSADAHHITASHPEGLGARLAMERAIKEAALSASHIDYINAHGTSTPLGDKAELGAISRAFNQHKLTVSSTKGAIGHLLSGAGAVEAAFTAMAIATGTVPPNRNFEQVDEGMEHLMDSISIPATALISEIRYALTNSFGFGGLNVSLCFGKI